MTIPPELLDLLQCPRCGEGLRLPVDHALNCIGCGSWYPVRQGIPILLAEVATPAPDENPLPAGLVSRYWDSPEQAALYDQKVEGEADPLGEYTHLSEQYALVSLYHPESLDVVLDAGCGNGRFLAQLPPTVLTVGADASFHLLRIARSKGRGRYHVCCALERLPFREHAFGTVLSCRVLQHIQHQQQAVKEMGRVTRPGGQVVIEVYNTWNLKTLYKIIRQSRWQKVWNAPFRWLFRSMSPFAPWGLDYDRYNSWWELQGWMKQAGLGGMQGRGAGLGYHKYFLVPFYLDAAWKNHAPALRAAYYRGCLRWEKKLAGAFPLRYGLEKFALRGEKGVTAPASLAHKITKTLVHGYHELGSWQARRELDTHPVMEDRTHLLGALAWLQRAQDVTQSGGVARGYSLGWHQHFQGRGWQPAYPETTGYLIPTFFNAARQLAQPQLAQRALAMADWEITVQLPNGAVISGTVDRPPQPAVFNTGQVVLGWLRAFEESGRQEFQQAALAAGGFLVRHQEENGGWRRYNSVYANPGSTTYNSRVGWALIQLGQQTGQEIFIEAGQRNIRHTLRQQEANGWLRENCLSHPHAPLTHTICYAVEGILGAATLLNQPQWRQQALVTVDALCRCITPQGRLPGRLDNQWQGTVPWDCLTGNAQLAAILLSLGRLEEAQRLLGFLKSTQNLATAHDGVRGGIKGSHPFAGGYGRYELLNWPTKFFVDALLLAESFS